MILTEPEYFSSTLVRLRFQPPGSEPPRRGRYYERSIHGLVIILDRIPPGCHAIPAVWCPALTFLSFDLNTDEFVSREVCSRPRRARHDTVLAANSRCKGLLAPASRKMKEHKIEGWCSHAGRRLRRPCAFATGTRISSPFSQPDI